MKRYYVTTPLYYVNDKPHIGTAYSTVMADVLNRYHQLFGEETFFMTGTDEHGQKCQQAADKRGMDPQAHCDDMVQNFKAAWKDLEIQYDFFFRTTDAFHKQAVQSVLQELYDKGDIYEDTYEGWYCVSEEIFYTEKELVDGRSPTGKEVQRITEKNYFFKMSKYQQPLIDHIEKNPTFIMPESRKNEVLGFLRQPLNDLCISRPKSRLSWGIEIPFDRDYVTYVWFDALLNYATGVGYRQPERQGEFDKWWVDAGAVHLIGKDIITTHAVYWTTMLMATGVRLPKTIFAHGWILNKDNAKMSKSAGEVINPLDIRDLVGVDAFRYFLVRDIHFGNDAPFSQDLVVGRVNTDLANNLGNLLSRSANLIGKYFDGKAPAGSADDALTKKVIETAIATADKVKTDIERMAPSYALEHVVNLLNEANKFLEEKAPWKQAKEDVAEAGKSLYTAIECLRIAAILLQPVMPLKMADLMERLGVGNADFEQAKRWGVTAEGTAISKGDALFPRI
ncbi:MAG: methionine--tRNA ligase [Bdellovibrionaceae bacterium]|nr:methionine--tRNA ligase [Bdellovibrionales bacterium]MCB9085981.1 methionine--tRNA ligase [Pseudobdellovibrionaceae bacterium]